MIGYEQWCRLKQLAERDHLNAAQIARALGLASRTVRKWLKEPYRPRKRVQRPSVLDPFKGQIMGMLKEHPYSAAQATNTLSKALKAYVAPRLLVVDESGYLPMDKRGADLLFPLPTV